MKYHLSNPFIYAIFFHHLELLSENLRTPLGAMLIGSAARQCSVQTLMNSFGNKQITLGWELLMWQHFFFFHVCLKLQSFYDLRFHCTGFFVRLVITSLSDTHSSDFVLFYSLLHEKHLRISCVLMSSAGSPGLTSFWNASNLDRDNLHKLYFILWLRHEKCCNNNTWN